MWSGSAEAGIWTQALLGCLVAISHAPCTVAHTHFASAPTSLLEERIQHCWDRGHQTRKDKKTKLSFFPRAVLWPITFQRSQFLVSPELPDMTGMWHLSRDTTNQNRRTPKSYVFRLGREPTSMPSNAFPHSHYSKFYPEKLQLPAGVQTVP